MAPETAVIIRSGYDKFIERISEVKDAAMAINVTDENDKKGMAEAKALRLKIKNARTEAEAKRKELKADALAYGRAVDGCHKKLEEMCLPLEEHLSLQEKYAELVAEKRRNDLIAERTAKLAPYSRVVNPATMRLGDINEDQFQLLLAGSENRLKEELEKDMLLEIHNERQRKLRLLEPYAHLHTHNIDTVDSIENIDAYIAMLKEKQAEQARELAATQQRLKEEQEAREKAEAIAKQAEADRVKAEEYAARAKAAQAKAREELNTTPLRFVVPDEMFPEPPINEAGMPDVMHAQAIDAKQEFLNNYIMELRVVQRKYNGMGTWSPLHRAVGELIRQHEGMA